MRIHTGLFNLFLTLLASALVGAGCASTPPKPKDPDEPKDAKESKQASSLRLHMETASAGLGTGKIQVLRTNSMTLNVEKNPFADEGFIERAAVVEGIGGHMILIKFNTGGTLRLQMWTVANQGRHIAVWSKWNQGRWLAAPVPQRPIEDGVFAFTPDATREESERIVRGLNNVAIKLGNQEKPKKQPSSKPVDKSKAKPKAKPTEDDMFLK